MTNQPNRDLTQQAHDLDDQQLEAIAGGFMDGFDQGMEDLKKGTRDIDNGPTVQLPPGGKKDFR
jgi:hypothetical protein